MALGVEEDPLASFFMADPVLFHPAFDAGRLRFGDDFEIMGPPLRLALTARGGERKQSGKRKENSLLLHKVPSCKSETSNEYNVDK